MFGDAMRRSVRANREGVKFLRDVVLAPLYNPLGARAGYDKCIHRRVCRTLFTAHRRNHKPFLRDQPLGVFNRVPGQIA